MTKPSRKKALYIGYLPFGNYPYAVMEDSRVDELLAGRYERTLAVLDRCGNAKMTLALTGQTKELVAREFPRTYRSILRLMGKGRLELTQCPYSHPLPLFIPHSSFIEHIKRDLSITKKHYGVHPDVFWSPECTWSPYLPEILAGFGAKSIYLRQLSTTYPVWLRGTGKERVIGFNQGLRPKWTVATTKARIRSDFAKIEKGLLKSNARYGFLLVFGDDIEMSGIEDEARLHERIFEVANGLPFVKPVLMSEFLAKNPPEEELHLETVNCWINHFRWWAGDIVDIHQNTLAEQIRRNMAHAGELAKHAASAGSRRLKDLRELSLDSLMLLESTEPKGWRPSLDRRLWGYRHAEKGLAYSRGLIAQTLEHIKPSETDDGVSVPLVESCGLDRTAEPVEVALSFKRGECKGGCRVELDGEILTSQLTDVERHPDGSISDCMLVFITDSPRNSVRHATVIAEDGSLTPGVAAPAGKRFELQSSAVTAHINLSAGGKVDGLSVDGTQFLKKGESLNTVLLTPTETFLRHNDSSPAALVCFEDGPVFSQALIRQNLLEGIDKLQCLRLYKSVPRLAILTELAFSHPVSLGVYQPWKQNKSDKSLILGDVRLDGTATISTTLPCSPDVIYHESVNPGSLRYLILGGNWAGISTGGRTLGVIVDGTTSKLDIARVTVAEGCTHLGLDGGSPSQFGPHYNDERHGFWSGTHRYSITYFPASHEDFRSIQREALKVNHPLFMSP
jgi:hypothetical protein